MRHQLYAQEFIRRLLKYYKKTPKLVKNTNIVIPEKFKNLCSANLKLSLEMQSTLTAIVVLSVEEIVDSVHSSNGSDLMLYHVTSYH